MHSMLQNKKKSLTLGMICW